jgi:hypothetical protein
LCGKQRSKCQLVWTRKELSCKKWGQMAESQISELQNMRVLMEEARLLARNFAYHRRANLKSSIDLVLDEIERQIEELRKDD